MALEKGEVRAAVEIVCEGAAETVPVCRKTSIAIDCEGVPVAEKHPKFVAIVQKQQHGMVNALQTTDIFICAPIARRSLASTGSKPPPHFQCENCCERERRDLKALRLRPVSFDRRWTDELQHCLDSGLFGAVEFHGVLDGRPRRELEAKVPADLLRATDESSRENAASGRN
jgi:hypothetical protein